MAAFKIAFSAFSQFSSLPIYLSGFSGSLKETCAVKSSNPKDPKT
jgi:hypothetical protein